MNTNNIQKVNYQKILDKITDKIEKECAEGENRPALFLHACCAPCSSYVLEYLTKYFKITIFYYNPNITPETEYTKRVKELQRFIHEAGYEEDVTFVEGDYDPQVFFDMARGMEDLPERGLRCYHCYALRMEEAAKKAAEMGADYFSTTLSISPHKNAQWINEIGEKLADKYGVKHLPSDFKKKGGYLRSIALSEEYHLYRQDYCGCVFSKRDSEVPKQTNSVIKIAPTPTRMLNNIQRKATFGCPLFIRVADSKAKVEKVVNPPQIPVFKKSTSFGFGIDPFEASMATKAIAIQPAENEIILICGLEASAGYERVFNTLRLKSQIRIFILSGRLFACGKSEFKTCQQSS